MSISLTMTGRTGAHQSIVHQKRLLHMTVVDNVDMHTYMQNLIKIYRVVQDLLTATLGRQHCFKRFLIYVRR